MNKITRRIILFAITLVFLLSSITSIKAQAIDMNFYRANDILYYDPTCVVSVGGDGTLVGSDNAEKILRFLVGKGLTLIQASGIIGNWYEESGLDPRAVQPSTTTDDPNYRPISGVGFGLAQWTYYTRQDKMYAYHKETGRSMIDLSFQLDWFWKEFTEDYAGGVVTLKEKTTISDAAVDFHNSYEGSDDTASMIQERIDSGTAYYEKFKSIIQDGSGASGGGAAGADCDASDNTNGEFIFYDQNDPAWKDIQLGYSAGETIGTSGCGPASMAMIITALTGQKVTPVETSKFATDNGLIDGTNGSSWGITKALATEYGLKAVGISNSPAAISEALKRGSMIHLSGSGGNPWTQGGHYIAIRGITAEGKWLLADPYNQDNNTIEWEPSDVTNGVSSNVWEVSK